MFRLVNVFGTIKVTFSKMRSFGALCLLLYATSASALCPPQVRVVFSDAAFPPFLHGDGVEFEMSPGILIEWTTNALRKLGCQPAQMIYSRSGYRRYFSDLEAGRMDIAVGPSYAPEREKFAVYPMQDGKPVAAMVIAVGQLALYTQVANQSVQWDGTVLSGENLLVGVPGGTIGEKLAQDRKWPTDPAPNYEANEKKLLAGRVPVILMPNVSLDLELAGQKTPRIRKLQPPVLSVSSYAPVSRQFYVQYPEFTRKFWVEVCRQGRTFFTTLPDCRLPDQTP